MKWRKDLGRQILNGRLARRLSQAQFGKRIGVSRQMVGRYEAGRAVASIEVLAKAAEALGIRFIISGREISFGAPRTQARTPKQLCFAYNKIHVFPRAEVKIHPKSSRILISAAFRA